MSKTIEIDPYWRKTAQDMAAYVVNNTRQWPREAKQVMAIELLRSLKADLDALGKEDGK